MTNVKKIFVGVLATIFLLEMVIRALSGYSYKIKYLSSNPYQQPYLTNIFSWKDLLNQFCCQKPGMTINGISVNAHGYLAPEGYEKPAGTKRLVLIGDSQAVGIVSYKENFGSQLEKRMREETKQKFDVINLGVVGAGPLLEEKVLMMEGLMYKPDVVMLAIFVGNDFYDDAVYTQRYKQSKHIVPLWMYQSRLFSFLRNSIRFQLSNGLPSFVRSLSSFLNITNENETPNEEQKQQTFSEDEYVYLESERAGVLFSDSFLYDHLSEIQKSIVRMKTASERNGAKFVALIIPDEFQLNTELLARVMDAKKQPVKADVLGVMSQYVYLQEGTAGKRQDAGYDLSLPQTILTNYFNEQNIQYIDVLPSWLNQATAPSYYQTRNTHLNVLGNEAIANSIAPVIKALVYPE